MSEQWLVHAGTVSDWGQITWYVVASFAGKDLAAAFAGMLLVGTATTCVRLERKAAETVELPQ